MARAQDLLDATQQRMAAQSVVLAKVSARLVQRTAEADDLKARVRATRPLIALVITPVSQYYVGHVALAVPHKLP